jgi:hypothetical protein
LARTLFRIKIDFDYSQDKSFDFDTVGWPYYPSESDPVDRHQDLREAVKHNITKQWARMAAGIDFTKSGANAILGPAFWPEKNFSITSLPNNLHPKPVPDIYPLIGHLEYEYKDDSVCQHNGPLLLAMNIGMNKHAFIIAQGQLVGRLPDPMLLNLFSVSSLNVIGSTDLPFPMNCVPKQKGQQLSFAAKNVVEYTLSVNLHSDYAILYEIQQGAHPHFSRINAPGILDPTEPLAMDHLNHMAITNPYTQAAHCIDQLAKQGLFTFNSQTVMVGPTPTYVSATSQAFAQSVRSLSSLLNVEVDEDMPRLPDGYEWKKASNGILFILTDEDKLISPFQMFDLVTIREEMQAEQETKASASKIEMYEQIIEKLSIIFLQQEKLLYGLAYTYNRYRGGDPP